MKQQNVYYCCLASSTFFSIFSCGEVSLWWYRLGQNTGKSFRHATRWVQIQIGTRRHIHSMPLATQQLVKVETVDITEARRDINELKLDLQLGRHISLYEIYGMSL